MVAANGAAAELISYARGSLGAAAVRALRNEIENEERPSAAIYDDSISFGDVDRDIGSGHLILERVISAIE